MTEPLTSLEEENLINIHSRSTSLAARLKLKQLEPKAHKIKNTLNSLSTEIDSLKIEKSVLTEKLKTIQSQLHSTTESLNEKQAEHASLTKTLSTLETEISSLYPAAQKQFSKRLEVSQKQNTPIEQNNEIPPSISFNQISIDNKELSQFRDLFKESPKAGMDFAISKKMVQKSPRHIAHFLRHIPKLDATSIGLYLGGHDDFHQSVLKYYCSTFDFKNMTFDSSLRQYLSVFRLPGEAQIIDRFMENFAKRYCDCNDDVFESPGTAFVLAFSLIMLNTDAHSPVIKKKMTKEQFIRNNQGIDGGGDLPKRFLEGLYSRIIAKEIKMLFDDQGDNIFAAPKKAGYLTKQGGKRKNWRKRWFSLSGSVLLYMKHPNDATPLGVVPLENLIVTECDKATKKRLGKDDSDHIFVIFDGRCDEGTPIKASKMSKQGTMIPSNHDRYYVMAENAADMREWIYAIRKSISRSQFYDDLSKRKNSLRNIIRSSTDFKLGDSEETAHSVKT